MCYVRPKKHLGQHFLKNNNVAQLIANTLDDVSLDCIIEIGPGTGVLTQFLIEKPIRLKTVEIDDESVNYLKIKYPFLDIIKGDFLKLPFEEISQEAFKIGIIGNFPYNISSQIVFKAIKHREQVAFFSGMFQKEVAERICADKGSKTYGIISVLIQAFYHVSYLFTVSEEDFIPPPKVKSGVISLTRKVNSKLPCDENMFTRIVKMSFNQRRKTIRNGLKQMALSEDLRKDSILDKRPEQLSVNDFINLTKAIENDRK